MNGHKLEQVHQHRDRIKRYGVVHYTGAASFVFENMQSKIYTRCELTVIDGVRLGRAAPVTCFFCLMGLVYDERTR